MGGKAVLVIRTSIHSSQTFALDEHSYRKKLAIDHPFTITLSHIGGPLLVQDHDGSSLEIKPGEKADFHTCQLFFETSHSLGLKLSASENIETAFSLYESMDLFLDPSSERSMGLSRFFHKKGDPSRSFWHLARAFTLRRADENQVGRGHNATSLKPEVPDFLYLLSRLNRDGLDDQFIQSIYHFSEASHPDHPALKNWLRTYKNKAQAMRNLSLVFAQSSITQVKEDEWHTYQGGFYKLIFPASIPLKWIQICRDTLQRTRQQLHDYIQDQEQVELQMIRLDRTGPSVRGMFYEDRIIVNMTPVLELEEIEAFRNTIKHEFIHMLNDRFIRQNKNMCLPRWLDEGLAYFLAGNLHPKTADLAQTVDSLEAMFMTSLGESVDKKAISTACRLVEHLIQQAQGDSKLGTAAQILAKWSRPGKNNELNAILGHLRRDANK